MIACIMQALWKSIGCFQDKSARELLSQPTFPQIEIGLMSGLNKPKGIVHVIQQGKNRGPKVVSSHDQGKEAL